MTLEQRRWQDYLPKIADPLTRSSGTSGFGGDCIQKSPAPPGKAVACEIDYSPVHFRKTPTTSPWPQ